MRKMVSAFPMALLLVGMAVMSFYVQPANASGTIYIRADGSIDPSTTPISTADNITYTFLDNINDSIIVERDDIVIDGNGYMLRGAGVADSSGISLTATRRNVTIKNANIFNFSNGIYLDRCLNCSIYRNNITNNYRGINLTRANNNSISGNNIIVSNHYSISLLASSNNNSISENNMTKGGIFLLPSSGNDISRNTFTDCGLEVYGFIDDIHAHVEDNTVNGKPLVYLEGATDYSVGDAGQVILVNCTNIRVENLNLSRTNIGVQSWRTSNSSITNNTITNNREGIQLRYSHNNSIGGNIITDSLYDGINLWDYCSNNSISGNTITNNSYGIMLESYCSDNTISGNTIATNEKGISLFESSGNSFYHNNFIYNTRQVYDLLSPQGHSINEWDSDYPSGGNYWSDYNGTDANYDGIGDTAYIVNENNTDRYPLMTSYVIPESPSFLILPLFLIAALIAVMTYRKKHRCAGANVSGLRRITEVIVRDW